MVAGHPNNHTHPSNTQVGYAWATSLSEDEAGALLRRLGSLAEGVVDHAAEVGAFAQAFQLAQLGAKGRLPEVHLKFAMFLEDSGRFQEAEGEFVSAGACCVKWLVLGCRRPIWPPSPPDRASHHASQASRVRRLTCTCTTRTGRPPCVWPSSASPQL
jgi:hypothetical protein